jgi:hypothetical protein
MPAMGQSTGGTCPGNSFNLWSDLERYYPGDSRQVVLVPAQKIVLVFTRDIKQSGYHILC